MHFHGITNPKQFALAQKILIPLGEYFQVQNDYLDCFAPPEELGKIGTDILENKNTWVVNVALLHATPAQRRILDENYGRKDSECERRVKEVFTAVGVEAKYQAFEQATYEKIMGLVETIPAEGGEPKRGVFTAYLNKFFGSSTCNW
jgi:farnesyl diphosphate synthase